MFCFHISPVTSALIKQVHWKNKKLTSISLHWFYKFTAKCHVKMLSDMFWTNMTATQICLEKFYTPFILIGFNQVFYCFRTCPRSHGEWWARVLPEFLAISNRYCWLPHCRRCCWAVAESQITDGNSNMFLKYLHQQHLTTSSRRSAIILEFYKC